METELYTAQCCKCLIKKEEYTIKPRPYDNHLCNECYTIVSNEHTKKESIIDIVKSMYH